jgi:hypothetical protein
MDGDIGAAVTVQANAIRVLEYLGYTAENLKGVDSYGVCLLPRRFAHCRANLKRRR